MGIRFAEELASGSRALSLYDPASGKTIKIANEILLNIEDDVLVERGIVLSHLPVGDLDSPQYIKFEIEK
ncbi:MAG: hypothetical protein B6D41_00610 [Chloroflexi bacterium UTCFX4]|jgi:hypothetical protein|nr:MAG: hypothetical protein B6D41_00610 [Chloroflexi bacterium UTCFX4]